MSLPRISYAEFQASRDQADIAWMEAFAKVEAMGVGAILGDWKITMLGGGIHPAWVQVKNKTGQRMVRRGDVLIHDLARFCANGANNG